jgi:hypothetical protein
MKSGWSHCLLWVCFTAGHSVLAIAQDPVRPIDFSRDIRPILSDKCFTCHGPDENTRASELRLDVKDSAFEVRGGHAAVVPGSVETSVLHQRITSTDDDVKMPPPTSGQELSSTQIELLTAWIEQGAKWTEHWAFLTPQRPAVPTIPHDAWSRNEIDAFVRDLLRQENLNTSDEASRRTLIRRVSLDLTGLPPTPMEVEAFIADNSATAYESLVDRLLASPRYGEHMAVSWLDAARYADTSGYQNDGPRDMWRWRDWVIDAFNSNKPFDQFTIEQLAGDMLENPTLDQRIATGFNRNHRGNAEGGIIPEEYQVEYVVDRVDTTSTVWLGLTMGCARCHDHKYDPIRQKDFYQVFACFNNIPENGRAIKEGNSPPLIKAPLPAQQAQLRQLDAQIHAAEAKVAELQSSLATAQQEWEATVRNVPDADWSITDGLVTGLAFDGNLSDTSRAVEVAIENSVGDYTAGRIGQAVTLKAGAFVNAGDIADFGYFDRFSIAAWIQPSDVDGTVISRMTPVEEGAGYYVHLQDGRLQVNLVKRWLDDAIRVESHDPVPLNQWSHLAVVYDGSRVAAGIKVYLDGRPVPMDVKLDRINQTFAVKTEPLRIGMGQSSFSGTIDDVRVYGRDLSAPEIGLMAVSQTVSEILALEKMARTETQQHKLSQYFLARQAPAEIRDAHHNLVRLQRERRAFEESLPTVMVMQEMDQPRATHVLIRGQYDQPGEKVEPGVPPAFPPLPPDAPKNRLGFAKWLVSPEHPLTARVAVNRIWQMHFGQGLVRTSEDFGAQGDLPSHPELLDWLATEFVQSGWDVKKLHRLIVTSATYRQSSDVSPELQRLDPDNRLLARGPRRRLSAEAVRDQALFVSGLLRERTGGPSVKPYQPDGLWKEIATDMDYVQSHGDDLYRRSVYTYLKRTVAAPTMVTFDATSREACTVQRSRTNTPLQALALMNDVTFMEAARVTAQRLLSEPGVSMDDRITQAFRRMTARDPEPAELEILRGRFEANRQTFQNSPESAQQLNHMGEFPVDDRLDPCELAAMTTVVSLMLNLDEVVTNE